MKRKFLLLLALIIAGLAYGQNSFKELLEAEGPLKFQDVVRQAEEYFAQKYPDVAPFALTHGAHRDGEYVKYQRWRNFWKSRLLKDGTLMDLSVAGRENTLSDGSHRASGLYDDLEWFNISYEEDLGVQIGMGRTSSLAFHPTDSLTFYVGTAIGGIWKTTDGGQSYIPLGDDLPFLAVSCIILNKDNPDHLYIAVSDRVWYGPPSIGIYKSVDGGATWEPAALTFNFSNNVRIYWMEADPNQPNIMWVGTSSGLYRTEDAFETVELIEFGSISDVKYRPGDSDVLYYVRRDPNRFYRSDDGGESFQLIQNFDSYSWMRIANTPLDPDKVYLTNDDLLHKSFDGGQSFPEVADFQNVNTGSGILMFSPKSDTMLYVGYFDMFYSPDDGNTFDQISHWLGNQSLPLIHVDQRNAFVNPLQSDLIYLCNDGGVYTVNVNNNQFTNLSNGLIITQFYDIAVSQSNPLVMSGGSQDNGNVFLETTGWERAAPTADGMIQAIDPTDENVRYNAIQNGVIYRFINGNRQNISDNIPGNVNGTGEWITPFVLDPSEPSHIYAAYRQVYHSTDLGISWTPIGDELSGGRNIDLLAAAPSKPGHLYAVENYGISTGDMYGFGHATSNIFVRESSSDNWIPKSMPVTEAVEDILIDPNDENIICISVSGYTNNHKVFKSEDGGDSWVNISDGLPNVPCTSIAMQNGINPVLFAGTDVGVFYREIDMDEWAEAGDFPNTYITDIEIQESDNLIRVGTHGRGIFEGELVPGISSVDIQDGADYGNCYEVVPNPVHDQLSIVDFPADHFIGIYDANGKLVRRVNQNQINISDIAKGVYYLVFVDRENYLNKCVRKIVKK
ncbi:MAG: T9SS type A sorting domain-containing protein [Bacteroidota bacterium]